MICAGFMISQMATFKNVAVKSANGDNSVRLSLVERHMNAQFRRNLRSKRSNCFRIGLGDKLAEDFFD